MAQRDYILRLIDQVGQFFRRAIRQREQRSPQDALQSVMAACERLFGMEAVQLFQFTPDQHVAMLAEADDGEDALTKIMMYAALMAEAGRCYLDLGQPTLAQASLRTALRVTLKARLQYPTDALPDFAPKTGDLLARLGDEPLDEETTELLAAVGKGGHEV
jgi:hypothetical protein